MQTLLNDVRDILAATGHFRYIDEDWGQLDEYNPNPPTKWPCALVDIVEAKPTQAGNKTQLLQCNVLIRIAAYRLNPSSQGAPAAKRDKAEQLFSIAQGIFAQLHGWHKQGSNYGSLSRTGFRRMRRDDGIREYQVLFSTALKDNDASPQTTDRSPDVPETIMPKVTVLKL